MSIYLCFEIGPGCWAGNEESAKGAIEADFAWAEVRSVGHGAECACEKVGTYW